MLKQLILTILILSSFHLLAQIQYVPAEVQMKDGSLLKGLILDDIDQNLHHQIYFKKDQSSEPEMIPAGEIDYLQIQNGRYFKSILTGEAFGNKEILGKRMLSGELTTYQWNNDKRFVYFVENGNANYTVIQKPVRQETVSSGERSVVSGRLYYQQLVELTGKKDLKYFNYNRNRILKILTDYNRENNSDTEGIVYREKTSRYYELAWRLPVVPYPLVATPSYSFSFFMETARPESNMKWNRRAGLMYSYSEWGNDDGISEPDENRSWDIHLIPFQWRRHWPGRLSPFFDLGFGVWANTFSREQTRQVVGEPVKRKTSFHMLPALDIGVGVKLDLGPGKLFVELQPTLFTNYLNVGLAF